MSEQVRSGAPATRRAAAVGLVVLAIGAALLQARSFDMWWHLEAGKQIVARHEIPRVDDFSFTSVGQPWVNHEWLFQVLIYAVYRTMGAWGLFLMKAACALATGAVLMRALGRAGAGPALALVSVCLIGMRFRLAERPEIATLLFAALTGWLLLELAGGGRRLPLRLAALAVVVPVWANLHAGALLAPLMALAVAAGGPMQAAAGRMRAWDSAPRLSPSFLAVGLAAAGVCLNPAGWSIYRVPFSIAGALAPGNLINPEWQSPGWIDFPLFHIAAAGLLLVGVAQVVRRDDGSLGRLLLLLLVAGLGWSSLRHVGVFFAVAPLALTGESMSRMARWSRGRLWAAVPAAALAWMLLVPPAGARIGVGIQPDRFPREAADFIDARLQRARLYNDVAFGGYLIWRGYPERRVFIDGRNEVHADLLRRLSDSLDDGRKWQELLAGLDLDGAVVGYRSEIIPVRDARTGATSSGTFAQLHFPRSAWALVHWDDVAMVYVRRQGRYARVADEAEYPAARPEAWKLGLEGHEGLLPPPEDPIVQDLRRKLEEDPDCRLAKRLAAVYRMEANTPKH